MNLTEDILITDHELQLYEPSPGAVYTIEAASNMLGVSRHQILVYCRHRLISPLVDPDCGASYFDEEAIRQIRKIWHLQSSQGVNLEGIRMILQLKSELARLEAELRFRRGN